MTDQFPKPLGAPVPSMPTAFNGEIYQAVGKYARSAVLYAFQQNGGPEGLAKWAKENEDDFYTKLFPKIIARESEVHHTRTVDQLTDMLDADYEVEGEGVEDAVVTYDTSRTAPLAHNWNAGDPEAADEPPLAPDSFTDATEGSDGFDLVDFG